MRFFLIVIVYFITVQSLAAQSPIDSLFLEAKKYKSQAVYGLALESYFKALESYSENDEVSVDAYLAIGLIYKEIANYNDAKKYFHLSLVGSIKVKDSLKISYAYNNLGMVSEKEKKLDSANYFYQKSLVLKKNLNDSIGISRTLTNIGNLELARKNYNKALVNYNQSLKYKLKLEDSLGVASVYNNIGNVYGYLGQFDSTKYYLNKGVKIAERNGYLELLFQYYHNLGQLNSKLKNYEKALDYNALLFNLKDSLFSKTMGKELVKQRTKYDVTLKDKEISILNKEKELSASKNQVMWVMITTLFVIAFLLFLLLRFRVKTIQQNKIAYNKQKEIDNLIIKTQQQEKQQLTQEKSQVERELIMFTLERIKNKETLKEVSEKLKKGKDALVIQKQINRLISNDDNWEEFRVQFEKVHPIFFDSLHKKFPNLTQTDYRHMAYIKIGMNTKEISRLLNIVPESVQKSRVRLKKKLKLEKDDNLIDFIRD